MPGKGLGTLASRPTTVVVVAAGAGVKPERQAALCLHPSARRAVAGEGGRDEALWHAFSTHAAFGAHCRLRG